MYTARFRTASKRIEMLLKLLKSKLHGAIVTGTKVFYTGSIAIDSQLMKEAGILPYECVLIANVTNGNRFETYAIEADPGSGTITVLGAAAKLVNKGDRLIIFAFAYCRDDEARGIRPKVLVLDENNKVC